MSSPFPTFGEYAALRLKLRQAQGTEDYFALIREADQRIAIGPPARRSAFREAEASLRGVLAEELKVFWAKASYIHIDHTYMLYSPEVAVRATRRIRRYSGRMPMSHLFFIGEIGDGDMFAMALSREKEWLSEVFIWEHEDDSRIACGANLWGYVADHLCWRLADGI